MTSPWTEPEESKGLTRAGWIGLLAVAVGALVLFAGFMLWPTGNPRLDPNVIVGEWQATDPPWHLAFHPDKTVEMIYAGSDGPESLAPSVATPGLPVAGQYMRTGDGTYKIKLANGKNYEAEIGKYRERRNNKFVENYVENRFDLTDVEGSSGVVVFEKAKK